MSQDLYYKGCVSIDACGKRTFNVNIEFGTYGWMSELEKNDVVKSLICGDMVTLRNNVIDIRLGAEGEKLRLREVLNLSERILQEDLKMDCTDDFGFHRQVITDSVKVNQERYGVLPNRFYRINFDLKVQFSQASVCRLEKRVGRESLVKIEDVKTMLEALKLEHDYPGKYRLCDIDGTLWIRKVSKRKRNLWNVYAKSIWNNICNKHLLVKMIQKTCPDTELRARLQKIDPSDIGLFENYLSEKEKNGAKVKAISKLVELKKDSDKSDGDELKKQVGLYIVSQIRANPQKYVKSYFSSIRGCAKEVLGESSL